MAKHLAPCARLDSEDRQFISIVGRLTLSIRPLQPSHVTDMFHSFHGTPCTERGPRVAGWSNEQDLSFLRTYRLTAYQCTLLVVGPGNCFSLACRGSCRGGEDLHVYMFLIRRRSGNPWGVALAETSRFRVLESGRVLTADDRHCLMECLSVGELRQR